MSEWHKFSIPQEHGAPLLQNRLEPKEVAPCTARGNGPEAKQRRLRMVMRKNSQRIAYGEAAGVKDIIGKKISSLLLWRKGPFRALTFSDSFSNLNLIWFLNFKKIPLKQWFSTWDKAGFALQGTYGDVWRHFGCHNWGGGSHYWHLVSRGQDADKYVRMQTTAAFPPFAPHNKDWSGPKCQQWQGWEILKGRTLLYGHGRRRN